MPFSEAHITERYISWLNDDEVMRYSEQQHLQHSRESCLNFSRSMAATKNLMLAIEAEEMGHIGNMCIYYDRNNLKAEVSIMVVKKKAWGRGYGIRAWSIAIDTLLKSECCRKVTAGTMAENHAIMRILKKSGAKIEAVIPRHFLYNGNEISFIIASKYADQ